MSAPATVLATWMLSVLARFEAQGVPLAALGDVSWIREAGERHPTRPLQLVAVRRLWHQVMHAVDDPGFGLRVGLQLPLQAMNVLAWLVAHSPTAYDGLAAAIRTQSLISNSGRFEIVEVEPGVELRYHVNAAPVAMHPAQVDSAFAGLLGLLQRCTSPPLTPLLAELPGVTAANAERYAALLNCPARPVRVMPRMLFARAALLQALPGADPELLALAQRRAAEMLKLQHRTDDLVDHVRARILARSALDASCASTALDMGLSVRTLQRRLAACGTSFRQLLEATRMEEALRLLGHPALTLADIADQLGYADASAFSHAVRAHWGTSPRRLRRELAG